MLANHYRQLCSRQLYRHLRVLALLLVGAVVFLSACQVYQLDVRQGNDLTSEMSTAALKKIQAGQSKEEVQAILGTPTLVPLINLQRWDYIYSLYSPNNNNSTQRQRLSLFFSPDNKLVSYKGDVSLPNF